MDNNHSRKVGVPDTKHRCKRAWGYRWRTRLQSERRSSMYVHQGVSTHFEIPRELETDFGETWEVVAIELVSSLVSHL